MEMKKKNGWIAFALATLLVAALLSAGCGRTTPVAYYRLTAVADGRTPATSFLPSPVVIGIGPVALPEYLDRSQIVTRRGANRLLLADSHRWAEPLADNIARVVRENLARSLGNERLLLHPWPVSAGVDRQVVIDILGFEAGDDGSILLEAAWSLKDAAGKVLLARRSSHRLSVAQPQDYDLQVGMLSEALARLSEEIAAALRENGTPPKTAT